MIPTNFPTPSWRESNSSTCPALSSILSLMSKKYWPPNDQERRGTQTILYDRHTSPSSCRAGTRKSGGWKSSLYWKGEPMCRCRSLLDVGDHLSQEKLARIDAKRFPIKPIKPHFPLDPFRSFPPLSTSILKFCHKNVQRCTFFFNFFLEGESAFYAKFFSLYTIYFSENQGLLFCGIMSYQFRAFILSKKKLILKNH